MKRTILATGGLVDLHWLEDGDHSFWPRKASGRTEAENWRQAA